MIQTLLRGEQQIPAHTPRPAQRQRSGENGLRGVRGASPVGGTRENPVQHRPRLRPPLTTLLARGAARVQESTSWAWHRQATEASAVSAQVEAWPASLNCAVAAGEAAGDRLPSGPAEDRDRERRGERLGGRPGGLGGGWAVRRAFGRRGGPRRAGAGVPLGGHDRRDL